MPNLTFKPINLEDFKVDFGHPPSLGLFLKLKGQIIGINEQFSQWIEDRCKIPQRSVLGSVFLKNLFLNTCSKLFLKTCSSKNLSVEVNCKMVK